jgi:hypothetical protein
MCFIKSVNIRTELDPAILVHPGGLVNEVNVDWLPQVDIAVLAALHGFLNTLYSPRWIVSQEVSGEIGRPFKPHATVAKSPSGFGK